MSLPFLDDKKIGAVIAAKQQPDGEIIREETPDDMQYIAEDMMSAFKSHDVNALLAAIRAMMEISR